MTKSRSSFADWTMFFIPLIVIMVVLEVLKLPDKWEAAIFGTAVVFLAVLTAFKPQWRNVLLWKILAPTFIVHIAAVFVIFKWQLNTSAKVPGMVVFVVGLIEYYFICGVLLRKGMQLSD